MPYIRAEVSKKLNELEKENLKLEFGKILFEVAGKPEKVLMISLFDNVDMYMAGEKSENVFVEIRYLGVFSQNAKDEIILKISDMIKEKIKIDNTYVNFIQLDYGDWGHNGKSFA